MGPSPAAAKAGAGSPSDALPGRCFSAAKLARYREDDNTLSVINGSNNTVTATIAVGGLPWGVAVNPQTNTVYVANGTSNTLSVISSTQAPDVCDRHKKRRPPPCP